MKEEKEPRDESLLWLFSEQLFRDQRGLQDAGEEPLNSQWLYDLWVYTEQFHKIRLPRSLQLRLNCGAWREPSSDFCLLAYIAANKQLACALPCHWLDKLICWFLYVSLMWNRGNNSGLRSHKLTQKYPDCQLEVCLGEPEQQRLLCHTFHRDLVLPSSWVGVQVDLDGHFSHGIIHTRACWKKIDTPPPRAHMDYWSLARVFMASGRQCGVFTAHLPEPAFQSALRMSR